MAQDTSFYNVSASGAVFQAASPDYPTRVTNAFGGTLYYKSTSAVSTSSSDGNLTQGQSHVFTAPVYLITAATGVNVTATRFDSTPPSALYSNLSHANFAPVATTTGTDTAGVNGTVWITSLQIPFDTTITGLRYLIGATGGTDNALAALYDLQGNVLANSATAGATVGTAATYQSLDFVTPYRAFGPATYFAAVSTNGNTATIRTVPASGTLLSTSATGTFGTVAAITPPTSFTAGKAPIVATY